MQEREAVARLKRGDISGLGALADAYYLRAVRAAYLVTRDRASAEDVVQDALIRVYEHIDQFDQSRPFGPWFLRSVVNAALNTVRGSKRVTSLDVASVEGAVVQLRSLLPSPEQLVDESELRREVWQALGQLPPKQRAVIVMRYYLDLSEAEMSERLEAPPGTIKWRLHSGRERLRTLLTRGNETIDGRRKA